MACNLAFVHPNDLHAWWHLVRPGLESVAARTSDGWIPEDVYTAIRNGQSFLHIGTNENTFAGFVVLTPIQGYKEKRCHIWCAYSADPKINAVEAFIGGVERLGEEMGARKVTFMSARRWDRKIERYGYKPTQTTYEKDLVWAAVDLAR